MYAAHPTKCLLLYAAGIGIMSAAAARNDVKGSISVIQTTEDRGVWGGSRSDFDNPLSSPNATSAFPVAGVNISASPSTSSAIDGWSWSIAVADDIPVLFSGDEYRDKVYTGGKLTLNAPSSLLNSSSRELSVHNDSQICIYQWALNNITYPAKLRADDGTCSSVLSSQCISDLKNAAISGQRDGHCLCPQSRKIPSCTALGSDSEPWETTCYGRYFDASRIREWKDGLEVWAYGGATAHDRHNTTAYNSIGSIAWPVMAIFGTDSHSTATLSCVRAKDAAQGSAAPTGDGLEEEGDQSSGSRISGNWFALGVIFVSYTLIL